jgi:hypothetical protein
MNNEFKKISKDDTTRYILESASGGGTSAGSIATAPKSMGGVQRRDNLLVQDANQKLTPRSPVAHAAQKVAKGSGRHTDRKQQSKQVRGEKHKTKDFAENQDHEISMAGSELHSIFQDAKQLHSMIKTKSEEEGLDAWQQSKITKAADYLNSVLQSLQHEMMGEGWSQKYKNSINCSHPKGFSQRAHCAGKRKHNESIEMEMTCPDCGMCETHGDNMMEVKQRLDAKCWKGKHKEGTKIKGGIRVNNCVPNEGVAKGLNEFAPDSDDDGDDDDDRYMEANFVIVKNGKVLKGIVRLFLGVTTDVEYDLDGTVYSKTEMDNVTDYDEFITNAKDFIDEIIQLNGDGNHFVEKQGVAEGLNEFAPDGFGGDDGDGFDPDMAKMAHEEGFTKGVSLAMVATLERAMEIGHWHKRHGGMYKHYFAKGFKEGRLARIRHDNKQYDLNLQLNKDGSISHGEQDMAEGGPFSYGKKAPRKGSVADLAAKRRQEQDRKTPPIEPKDQMVGTAKVITKDVKERYDEWDEGDVMYRWDDSNGTIRKRSIAHAKRRESLNQGWRDSVEQVLRDQNIIRSKFNPNKWVQKQGNKWIQVFPFGQDGMAESQLAELDRPSGKLFIIVKADNAGATHVFGDFGSFPQDVMHKISKRGTRDKSGAKTKLKIDFLFDDFRSTIHQLRTIFRDVDFVGAEAAEFIIHSSALRSDQGEDVKHLRDYIEAGDDRRMKIYQAPEDDEEDDGETTGGSMLRIDPETGAARKVVGVKPQTQMGGKSAEQPGMTTYRFKDPRFAQQLRGMNLGFNIKGDSITVDQKQKAKLISMLGNKFGDIFTSQERFKEEDAVEAMLPKSAFAGSDKNKLGPAAHLKGSMKRPARAGDLVGGDAQESRELSEKAVSQQQQKFFGMVHAMQKGKKIPGASAELKKTAKSMSKSDAKDFAKTRHAGLPKKVSEGGMSLPPPGMNPEQARDFANAQMAGQQAINQHAAQQANTPPKGINYAPDYLEQAASGAPGRWMISASDAKIALDWLAKNPNYKPPAAQPSTPAAGSGYSREYLEKAADPNRFGRYMISVEKAQELLGQMKEDTYMESLSAALEQKLSVNDTPEVWRDDFVNADPVKYKQFRNKTDEKKRHMADVARYRQIQKK